ncbi:MAG TPA: O-antigen ligase family protein [Pyrinomonadaceae bacterium]|nr:O-antigen ligase family protein [Pyrinomonadaceae bacterium]
MSQESVANFATSEARTMRLRLAALLNQGVFGSLLLLLVLSAIPYGTVEPWWKAAFVCAVFSICIAAIVESLLSRDSRIYGLPGLLLSMLVLCGFAFLQTLTIRSGNDDPAVATLQPWNAISADPYQTRFFVLQLLALTTCLALLYRYCRTERRINLLIHVILAVAVASALFGIFRQTLQQHPGFVLPRTLPGQGYGQFINKNHFAYLMEMALGLGIGMGLGRGIKRERVMIYVALLLPVWTGLVLSNSRGGILAMLTQVVVASILLAGGLKTKEKAGLVETTITPRRSMWIRVVLLLCLIAVIIVGTVWVGGDRLVSNFGLASSEFNPSANDLRGGVTRSEIWRASWKMFTAHPIVGVGLGGYWIAVTSYHNASGVMTPQEAHNDYLELLSSGGVVGLAIGIWFVVSLFRGVRGNLSSNHPFQRAVCFSALLGITGVAVHSLVDFGLHLMIIALVFLGLVMVATQRIEVER